MVNNNNNDVIVAFRCLGDQDGPRFLDGRTFDGTVGLAPSTDSGFTGTRWIAVQTQGVAFRCLGDQDGPRFLDGRTADGTVGLAPSIDGGFTGTRWKLTALTSGDPQQVTLECLGDQDGSRFLDARTADGTVGLAPSTDGFSGTRWEIIVIAGQNAGNCEQFLSKLGERETGKPDAPYDTENDLGFIGRYQFGEALLKDLKYYDVDKPYNGGGNGVDKNYWRGAWTGKNGINSKEEFKQNKNNVQETAIREEFSLNWERISQILQENGRSIEEYIGQERKGVIITRSGILAGAHLTGAMGVTNLLLKNEDSSDENGTSILVYLKEFASFDPCI